MTNPTSHDQNFKNLILDYPRQALEFFAPEEAAGRIKTGLVIEIRKAMHSRGLTQQEAAKLMGITQPKVSDMMRGDFSNLSERKLMDCLTRLGYDIEIKVRPAKTQTGQLLLAMA